RVAAVASVSLQHNRGFRAWSYAQNEGHGEYPGDDSRTFSGLPESQTRTGGRLPTSKRSDSPGCSALSYGMVPGAVGHNDPEDHAAFLRGSHQRPPSTL